MITQKFIGRERDGEMAGSAWQGLDYFGARYMSSAQGRFTSPDEPLNDQDAADPQSWNLYSYVRNNPLKFTDPTGRDCIYTSSQTSGSISVSVERGDCSSSSGYFVNGTIDTKSLTYKNGFVNYAYMNGDTFGAGTLRPAAPVDFGLALAAELGRRADAEKQFIGVFAAASVVAGAGVAAALPSAASTAGIISQTAGYLTKAAARAALARLELTAVQAAAAASAISRATSTSSVQLIRQGSDLIVRVICAGVNGYQAIESTINQAGDKQVVQKAFDAAGSLVHYDPK